jgi:tripeptidyl-peptidase-1
MKGVAFREDWDDISCDGNASACSGEAALDVQVAMSINPNAEGHAIGTQGYEGWIAYFDQLHTNKLPLPTVISTSYGDFETKGNVGIAIALCNEFYTLAAAGVTTLAASGDGGAGDFLSTPNCSLEHPLNQSQVEPLQIPATCPFVTAVGGSWTPTWGCNDCEVAAMHNGKQGFYTGPWQEGNIGYLQITSTGGYSKIFTKANGYDLSFQEAATAPYTEKLNNPDFLGSRAIPDIVSMSADFTTFNGGKFSPVAGTSGGSPTLAAILTQAYTGTPFGWINPLLYEKLAENEDNAYFWDITEGNNSWNKMGPVCLGPIGFECAKGWDPVTGVGSFGSSKAGGAQRFLDVLRQGSVP